MSELDPDSGSPFAVTVFDYFNANRKGQIDGILSWNTGVFVAGNVPSIPDHLNLTFEGDICTLSQDVTWP